MANDQRDMNAGNQDKSRVGMDNQSSDSGMGSQSGMGNADSGMGGMQRGAEGMDGQSQGISGSRSNQGGLGSDLNSDDMDDLDVEGGDSGRGSSSGSGRSRGSDDTMSGSRSGEGGM